METYAKTDEIIASDVLAIIPPIQSISCLSRCQMLGSEWWRGGDRARQKNAIPRQTVFMMAAMKNPYFQPSLSAIIPPSTKPTVKPMGLPLPIDAKATFLAFPSGNDDVMMLTAEGRQNELATPARPRNITSSGPVRDKPHAIVKTDCRKQPNRYIGLLPITSERRPAMRSVQPLVRAKIDDGLTS
jgi:hypothetical protein